MGFPAGRPGVRRVDEDRLPPPGGRGQRGGGKRVRWSTAVERFFAFGISSPHFQWKEFWKKNGISSPSCHCLSRGQLEILDLKPEGPQNTRPPSPRDCSPVRCSSLIGACQPTTDRSTGAQTRDRGLGCGFTFRASHGHRVWTFCKGLLMLS